MVTDSCWEESRFSLRLQPPEDWPCFHGWPPIFCLLDSGEKEEGEEEGETNLGGRGRIWEELGGGEYDPNPVHDILKELFKNEKICMLYISQLSGSSLTKLNKPTHPQRTFSLWSLIVLWLQSEAPEGFSFLGKSLPSPGTLEEPVSWLLDPVVSQSVPSCSRAPATS